MSKIVLFTTFIVLTSNLFSQIKGTRIEECEKEEIEIISGITIPKDFLIVSSGFFFKNKIGSSLSELIKKDIRIMQSKSDGFNCCTVYIDFKQYENSSLIDKHLRVDYAKNLQKAEDDGNLIHFYILSPFWEVD